MNSAGANGVTFTPSNSNNDTASNLASDFRELHLIIPNDPLHQQMADLMSALEKATTSTRGTNRQQDGPTRMDTSPCKRKTRKKPKVAEKLVKHSSGGGGGGKSALNASGSSAGEETEDGKKRERKKQIEAQMIPVPATIYQNEEGEAEAELSAPECDQQFSFSTESPQQKPDEIPHFFSNPNRIRINANSLSAFSSPGSLPVSKSGLGLKLGLLPTPTLPISQFIAAESDSFTDTWTPARKQYRKKRLIKKMAVDYLEGHDSPVAVGTAKIRNSGHKSCPISENMPTTSTAALFAAKSRRRLLLYQQRLSESSIDMMDHDGARSFSSVSSSDSETGFFTNDEGREADDEQSDWFLETSPNDECMGVPEIHSSAKMSPISSATPTNETSSDVPGPSSCSTIKHHIPDSSDTENSQQSAAADRNTFSWRVHRYFPRRGFGKQTNRLAFLNSLQRKMHRFREDSDAEELDLGLLKKREKRDAIRMASYFQLDAHCRDVRRRLRSMILTKQRSERSIRKTK